MRQTGRITTYFETRNFGFITSDVDGVSRFFHKSNYQGMPQLGAAVEYEIGDPTRIGKDVQCVKIIPLLGIALLAGAHGTSGTSNQGGAQ